jgi:uncharacterized protein (DUF934 family)
MNAPTPLAQLQPDATQIFVFDLNGLQVQDHKRFTRVIEPALLIAEQGTGTMSQKIQTIADQLSDADVIAIKFDKFADGRSYSIAARLRESGYRGELHAIGDINQELVFMLRRVGFTHFHIPNPGTAVLAPHILEPFAGYYQAAQDGSRAPWQSSF